MLPEWMQDPEGLALLSRCKETPGDIAPRLILADWLEEREDAEVIRCLKDSLANYKVNYFNDETYYRLHPFIGFINGWLLVDPRLEQFPELPWFTAISNVGLLEISIDALAQRLANDPATRHLCVLELIKGAISEDALTALVNSSVEQLHRLNLTECSLGDAGARVLAGPTRLTRLAELGIAENQIGNEAAIELLGSSLLKNLHYLDISRANANDAGMIALADNPHTSRLVELIANGVRMSVRGLQAVLASPHLRNLEKLSLEYNNFGDTGLAALAASPLLGRSEVWSFRVCNVRNAGVTATASAHKWANPAIWRNPVQIVN